MAGPGDHLVPDLGNLMVKRVLMVAFQYPPMSGTSGMQRTLRFSNYLLEHDWKPTVLTVSPLAYDERRDDQLTDIAAGVDVVRAWGCDAARHLSIRGKYVGALARPDRWANWRLFAVPVGLGLHIRERFDVLWSTYPLATTHRIAYRLRQLTGLPWIADFRDMMYDETYPADAATRRLHEEIEALVVRSCDKVVLTTPGTTDLYRNRYSDQDPDKFICIPNGFDEKNFQGLPTTGVREERKHIEIVHSGSIHPVERSPECFFHALAQLREEGFFDTRKLLVKLRAADNEDDHERLLNRYEVGDLVKLMPGISYRDALAEMADADGLLLIQGDNCSLQVPAKVYEYFRAGRPVFALTNADSDTGRTLTSVGQHHIANINRTDEIKRVFAEFIDGLISREASPVPPEKIRLYDRRFQTSLLAELLDELNPS